jgi:hypothetical protein
MRECEQGARVQTGVAMVRKRIWQRIHDVFDDTASAREQLRSASRGTNRRRMKGQLLDIPTSLWNRYVLSHLGC